MSGARLFEINVEFHEMIASFSGNRFFIEAMQHQNRLRRAVEYQAFSGQSRMLESCREHLQILAALEQGDKEWAASLMTHHLKGAQRGRLAFETPGTRQDGRQPDRPLVSDAEHTSRGGRHRR